MNTSETPTDTSKKGEKGSFIRVFLITFFVALLIRLFIAQPFIINGDSMEPTFESGEYLIVDEVTYKLGEPQRGEVIIFKFPKNQSKFFIKRIVGLPNESIEIKNGKIFITDATGETKEYIEEYITEKTDGNIEIKLGKEEYFVMGDNRIVSSDSRRWGPVQKNLIVGRAFMRFLPITKIGVLPGNYSK